MTSILKYILFIAVPLLVSCDPLGMDPVNQVDEKQFWENPQLARSYVNDFYRWSTTTDMNSFQSEQWSDNSIGNLDDDFNSFRQESFNRRQYDDMSQPDCFTAPWDEYFYRVHAVNLGIERIGTSTVLEERLQKQLLAECYFFRAWTYFEMEKYWGAFPYLKHTLTIADETMLPRDSRQQVFDNILDDLTTSARLFQESGSQPLLGMVNEAVATAFKSRVALYAACASEASEKGIYQSVSDEKTKQLFTFTTPPATYYEMAYEAAGSLMGKYELENEYADLFNTETGYLSKEALWPRMYNFTQISSNKFNPAAYNGPSGYYYGGNERFSPSWPQQGSAFPTQDLVDCYYQQDSRDGKWKPWWKTTQSIEIMGGTIDAEGNFQAESPEYDMMYKDRDKRLYATVLHEGACYGGTDLMHEIHVWIDNTTANSVFKYSALHTGFRQTMNLEIPTGKASMYTITGYYPRKYMPGKTNEDGTINTTQTTTTMFMLRYAEVLLNYAEAAIRLNKPEQAIDPINQIRERAGMDKYDAAAAGNTLWEEYKLQRRVEFAFEIPGQRYFDLLRWNEAEGNTVITELNRGPKIMQIFRKGIESEQLGMNGTPVLPGETGYFTPIVRTKRYANRQHSKKFDHQRFYFFPFSQSALQSYRGLTQNPGWKGYKSTY